MNKTSFLWLEITKKCQLTCVHCYADSGPRQDHGEMTRSVWLRVIDDAASAGVENVQFIGGEPTLHPNLSEFVERALAHNIKVEVFSNLANISQSMWQTFSRPGVSLATSYYSDDSTEHEAVTGAKGSYPRTSSSIGEAVKRSIPIRVGVIEVTTGQRTAEAVAQLQSLGVKVIGTDRTRKVGRGGTGTRPDAHELCGKCTQGRLAISTSGDVWPCVFSRWLPVGNVRKQKLTEILDCEVLAKVRADLNEEFEKRADANPHADCYPDCGPACQPNCPPSCSPSCSPTQNCTPSGNCWPNYR